jgi:hypothetical protein
MNGWACFKNKPRTPRLFFAKFKPNVRLNSPGDLTNPNKLQVYKLNVQSRLLHPCSAQFDLVCTLKHVRVCVLNKALEGQPSNFFTIVNGVGMGRRSL